MTITQSPSASLIAVVGATGVQGGSVVKALAESDKQYRVRGFTRDLTKPAAEALKAQGVEVVAVNLVVDNKDEVYRVFGGADYAFLMTNGFRESGDEQKEITEGKLLIDAAQAAGAKGVIWSGLPSCSTISRGKYARVLHFDAKALVSAYGRASSVPFVDVHAGFYATNFHELKPALLTKQPQDGAYLMMWALSPETVLPVIDMDDYGLFVRRVFEAPVFPDGTEVFTGGEDITVREMLRQLSEATGKSVAFQQITAEEGEKGLAAVGLPPPILNDMIDLVGFLGEFGYYGGRPTSSHEGLGRKPRTWAEFVKTADWSKVLE
ncbi:NAD(P)-binding protein [Mycena filopes]|nr:NAD(P)-binding protein [Mycena filopes]